MPTFVTLQIKPQEFQNNSTTLAVTKTLMQEKAQINQKPDETSGHGNTNLHKLIEYLWFHICIHV